MKKASPLDQPRNQTKRLQLSTTTNATSSKAGSIRRELVLRLQVRLSSRLSNVVAVISERRKCIPKTFHESLKEREWKKCRDADSTGRRKSIARQSSRESSDSQRDNLGTSAMWKEIGRTELLEDVSPDVLTPWLVSFCADIMLVRDSDAGQYKSLPENERRVAIYHVPHVGLECHSVDNFVPVGYAIIDLVSLLPLGNRDDIEDDEYWGLVSSTGMGCAKHLQPFQHMSIADGDGLAVGNLGMTNQHNQNSKTAPRRSHRRRRGGSISQKV